MSYLISAATLAVLAPAAACLAAWQVELNHPESGLYERGDGASVVLRWEGSDAATPAPRLAVFDYLGHKVCDLPQASEDPATGLRTIKLATDTLGYFEIQPLVEKPESVIPPVGSRPGGRLTYAIVEKINPNPSADYQHQFLSIQGTTVMKLRDGQQYGWNLYPYLGIQSVGVGYQWNRLEPTSPDDFAKVVANDHQPEWVQELKLHPYFHLNGTPDWAIDKSRLPAGKSSATLPPKDYAAYEAHLERTVKYIVERYKFLPSRTYEMAWEPHIPWNWNGSYDELVKMFEVAHRVVHKCDPHGLVAGPTPAGLTEIPMYEQLLQKGLGKYIDVVAFHTYKGYPPETAGIPQSIATIREITKRHVGAELPFMGTEYGFQDYTTGSVLNQSYGEVTALLIFKGEGAIKHTLFYLADYATEPGYGLMYNLVPAQPWGPAKVSPKPGIPMVRAAIDQVGQAKVAGRLDYLGAGIWAYVFRDGSTLLSAIWDGTGKDREIAFETGSPSVECVDCFGNRRMVTTQDGIIHLKLGRAPQYVRGLSADLYGENRAKSLLVTDQVWRLFRGQNADQQIRFSRTLSDKPLTLTFDTQSDIWADQYRQEVKVVKDGTATVRVPVSPTAPLGNSLGYFRLRDGQTTVYRGIQQLAIVDNLEVGPATAALAQGHWRLVQGVKNISPLKWTGQYTVTLAGQGVVDQPLTLSPGESRVLDCLVARLPDATTTQTVASRFESTTGAISEQSGKVCFFAVQQVAKASAGEALWTRPIRTPLRATAQTIFKQHPSTAFRGDKDLSAEVSYAFDEQSLFVQVLVEDDVHRCDAAPAMTWQQDSVQLGFDVLPSRERNSNTLAEQFDRTDCEMTFAFTTRGAECYLSRAPGGSKLEVNAVLALPGLSVQGGRQGTLTTYRITIPWTLLDPRHVRSRTELGVALLINDSDVDSPLPDRRAISLFDGILSAKDPSLFGRAAYQADQ